MIRNLKRTDKENWAKLYNGYAKFYKVPMNTGILDTLWGDIMLLLIIFFNVVFLVH